MKVKCPFCGNEVDIDPSNPYCPVCNGLISVAQQSQPPQPPPTNYRCALYAVNSNGTEEFLEEVKDAELVLGRARMEKYAWRDPQTISRVHVKFKKEGSNFYVYDEGSTNGTYIDGQDIRGKGKIEIKDGMEIRLVNPSNPAAVIRVKMEPLASK